MKKVNKKFFLLTYGCQMNKNDSERIAGLLSCLGLTEAKKPSGADLLIINTCSVRQAAEDRVVGMILNWQEFRKTKPELIIAVTGCLPGRDKDGSLKKKLEGVDLFFGIEELPILPRWLGGLWGIEEWLHAPTTDYLEIEPKRKSQSQAFITIQTGCNNFCTYCVVPAARGREKNRRVNKILEEIEDFVAGGGREVTLLGQVVNHYIAPDPEKFDQNNPFKGKDDFAALLWEVNQIAGDFRVHWTAADPQYFSDYQIEALKLPKQVNYLHLPAQSGDNEILKKMNRHYTREEYLNLVKKIRLARPEMAIGTDLVLGFCGEDEEQFQHTVDLFRQCDFDIAYQAMYSERSGTVAAKVFVDDVSHLEKKRRWQVIQNLMEETTYRKNQKYLHQIVEVLVDKCEQGVCSGNSREMKLVRFTGDQSLAGKMVKVQITQAKIWLLLGKIFTL
jgi:tRNA-2-methylthio-N6-dimethylallyladenosine synthase